MADKKLCGGRGEIKYFRGHGVLSNKGLWGGEDIKEGWGPMLYVHLAPPLLRTFSCRDILCTVSIKFNLQATVPSKTFFRDHVSGLLVAVYSHNLVAIINCDYPSRTPQPLLPGCLTSRLIESQVSINYQGVPALPDSICSVLGHHVLPSYPRPPLPSSRPDWSGGE